MTIIINYKNKTDNFILPKYIINISNNTTENIKKIITSYIINKGLLTVFDFNNLNFFKNELLTYIISYILSKIPEALISLKNMSLSSIKFSCNLRTNKLYKTSVLPETIASLIIKNNDYLLSITEKNISYKILFISKFNTFNYIKNNYINKISHFINHTYFENKSFNKQSYDFINSILNQPITNSTLFKNYKLKKITPIPTITHPFKRPLSSPTYKSTYKLTDNIITNNNIKFFDNNTIKNYNNIMDNIPIQHFTDNKLDLLKKLNTKHYQQVIQLEKTIESYHQEEIELSDIKNIINNKISQLEEYLYQLKNIIKY